MKSQHRHELETNVLAKHLSAWGRQIRPYLGTLAAIVVTVVVVVLVWTVYSNLTSAQHSEAWTAYNQAVETTLPDLEQLRASSEQYPGTKMKELADVTWADGQVWLASREYLYQRSAALESLNRARSAYEGVLRSSSDRRLVNRARLGLARIYELQNDLEQAREEYLKVEGAFAELARQRAEELADESTHEAYRWLATAEPPRRPASIGPPAPGVRPDFSAADLQLPGEAAPGAAPGEAGPSLEGLLQEFDFGPDAFDADDRYDTGDEVANGPAPDEPEVELPLD